MRFKHKLAAPLLIVFILIAACGGNQKEDEVNINDVVMTSAVGTMVAGFFETQTAMVTSTLPSTNTPPPTNTFLPTPTMNVNTATPFPTWTQSYIYYTFTPGVVALTPSVTGTLPTATVNSGALAYGCNNLAFIRDVNYPSGTVVAPGEDFTKTWKVQNTGSCEWRYIYTLSVVGEDKFDSSWDTVGKLIQPNDWYELSVYVTAPKQEGTYSGYWRLTDGGGHAFGATLTLTVVVSK